ncbi:MAG: trypsin-like peptidase domain-containing protein [Bacteroidales bacterium]|jgi:Do/DeqQ family serine protease|nr:trypsin-like peptidase domain-containing protein [Bacteroidales bacterium]
MKIRNIFFSLFIAVAGGIAAVCIYARVNVPPDRPSAGTSSQSVYYAALNAHEPSDVVFPDFTYAAEKAVHCVVHVKVKSMGSAYGGSGNPIYDFFYGYREPRQVPREGYGSGVIISEDGYIVTNNHVIDRANEIEVTLNDKRVFSATLVGADPNTDLALLKVDETGLPFLTYGNSEALRVGEWVLAVGNPYNLTSTVTAGIISAKARHLGIYSNRQRPSIEAFIQTDAAVNPGNSGGALVNTKGDLVGINAVIASQTGSYSGNSFAIPTTIVQKVIADLKEYGSVQRAMLGIYTQEITSEFARDKKITKIEGIYVENVVEDGAAATAGIREGDIVKALNGVPVNSYAELQEQLSKYRPNDQIEVAIERDNKLQQLKVTLKNEEGNTKIIKIDSSDILGAKFEGINERDKRILRIQSGVRVKELNDGKLKEIGIKSGFVIVRINDVPVHSVGDVREVLSNIEPQGRVMIDGVYPNGRVAYYGFAK